MAAALTLAERGRGRTAPNPNVGCVIVRDGQVVGRGWTQPSGRPHAEAVALAEAGAAARGATAYVTLEPCAHQSPRGPACSKLLVEAGVAHVVIALGDPDPRTDGGGIALLEAAGIAVTHGVLAAEARQTTAGFLARQALDRPQVTLKLATSLDGCIALANGESRWITGPEARAHAHLERARHEAILVGRGTLDADAPRLDVRLSGLEARSPRRVLLSASHHPCNDGISSRQTHRGPHRQEPVTRSCESDDWVMIDSPQSIEGLRNVDHILVEGGAATAASFLASDLVDRLLLYRAPIVIGGKPALGDIGLAHLADAHDRWRLVDARRLGSDRLEVYLRRREAI